MFKFWAILALLGILSVFMMDMFLCPEGGIDNVLSVITIFCWLGVLFIFMPNMKKNG